MIDRASGKPAKTSKLLLPYSATQGECYRRTRHASSACKSLHRCLCRRVTSTLDLQGTLPWPTELRSLSPTQLRWRQKSVVVDLRPGCAGWFTTKGYCSQFKICRKEYVPARAADPAATIAAGNSTNRVLSPLCHSGSKDGHTVSSAGTGAPLPDIRSSVWRYRQLREAMSSAAESHKPGRLNNPAQRLNRRVLILKSSFKIIGQ